MIVGVGQVSRRPGGPEDLNDAPSLMAEAAREAERDAGQGGLLDRVESLRTVESLGWRADNPPAVVAAELGISPRDVVATATGGNGPLSLLHDTCAAIAAGDLDVALMTGAEAFYSRRVAKAHGTRAPEPTGAATGTPRVLGHPRPGNHPAELEVGLALPTQMYPLFSNAMARAQGGSSVTQRHREAELWSRFSEVAATNPYAWLPHALSPAEVGTADSNNRMIAFPYTKRCCANIQVDQSAAVIVMSAAAAQSAGVARDRWVFPWAGTEANDQWFVSERDRLDASPAVRLCWKALSELTKKDVNDLAFVDLYSCFPSAVMIAAAEIGLDTADPSRPLTLTGGLAFAGGPGNNYSMHSLATLVGRLREETGVGLVTGVGWFMTKHALSLLGSEPPPEGFVRASVQSQADALPRRGVLAAPPPGMSLETFTVVYDRDGQPEKAFIAGRDAEGSRGWLASEDPELMRALVSDEEVALP